MISLIHHHFITISISADYSRLTHQEAQHHHPDHQLPPTVLAGSSLSPQYPQPPLQPATAMANLMTHIAGLKDEAYNTLSHLQSLYPRSPRERPQTDPIRIAKATVQHITELLGEADHLINSPSDTPEGQLLQWTSVQDLHQQAQAANDSLNAMLTQSAPMDMEQDPPAQPSPNGVKHPPPPPCEGDQENV